jgi:hypothetical protein
MSGAPDQWADFRYQGQSKFAGQPATDLQKAYATGNAPYVDPNAPAGSPTNPSYDTPDNTGGPGVVHVTEDGRYVDGQGQVVAPIADHWADFRAHEPRMLSAEDAARTAPGAIARGFAGIGGILGDAQNAGQTGFNWLADHALAAAQDATGKDFGVAHHPHTEAQYQGILNGGGITSGDLNTGIQGLFGTYHQPQTMAGRAVDTVGQMAPAALIPGSFGARLARVLVPSAASETAGEMTHGQPYEGAARLAGALVGGGVQGFWEDIANAPQVATARFLKGYTPAQIADAIDFKSRIGATQGLDLTPLEALTQRSGGAANQLQHYVENSANGKPLTAPFFDARRGQVKSAAQWAADLISPDTGQTPGMLGVHGQQEAQSALLAAEKARTAHVTPDYTAAGPQRVPAADMEGLLQGIEGQMASDKTGLVSGKLAELRNALIETPASPGSPAVPPERVQNGATFQMQGGSPAVAPVSRVPLTDVANLDRVRKYFRDRLGQPAIGEDALTKEQASAIADHLQAVDGLMEQHVPAFASGKAKFQQFTQAVNDPLNASPLGAIAKSPDVTAQTGALYPHLPNVGGVPELVTALQRLPQTGAPLTRQHILDTTDKALGNLVGGENPWAGAALAKALAGTDERAARLHAGVQTASGDPASTNLADLLEGLQATGKRLPPGSGTQFNAERAAALGVSPLPVRSISSILDPLEIGKHINTAVGGALYKRNIGQIADMLTQMPPQDAQAFLIDALGRSGVTPAQRSAQLLLNGSGAETRH